jgi:hypothetical protein
MISGPRGVVVFLVVLLSLGHLPSVADAQQLSDAEKASALFEEGKQLMAAQRFGEACQRFEASDAIVESGRALLNLADCLEKDGRFASAWAKFQASAARAHGAGLRDIEKFASDRAAALAPKVARVVLVPAPVDDGRVTIAVDGRPVERSLWGGFPVDPGAHEVTASAQGKKAWSDHLAVGAGAGPVTVAIPVLVDAGFGGPPALPRPAPEGQAPAREHAGGTQRIVAIVAAAVGVVALGTGIVLGLSAKSSYDSATKDCVPRGMELACPSGGNVGSADTMADFSTGAFVVAGAALAGAGVLWFTAPSRANVTVGVTPAGVTLRGSF